MTSCNKCGTELVIGINWSEGRKRNHTYICKSCANLATRDWVRRNYHRCLVTHRKQTFKRGRKISGIIRKKLGNKCLFCGFESIQRNVAHEIHGKDHHTKSQYYILNNLKDFVPLCRYCHKSVHWCMKYLGMNWEEIKQWGE
jgi:hypothetical protein